MSYRLVAIRTKLDCRRLTVLSSAIRRFTDPDDYAAAIRQTSAQITVTGRGHFTGQIVRVDLHRLWAQRYSESLPRIMHTDSRSGRAIISFRTLPGPAMSWGGFDLKPADILRHRVGGTAFQHTWGPVGIGTLTLPLEDIDSVGATIAGRDLTPPRDTLVVTPRTAAMAKLQRLHAAAAHLAETAPEIIAHPEAARGLEQVLIEAMVGCLTEGETDEERSAQRRHALIMQRFHKVIEEHPNRALYVPEICKALGVAERTLRTCCQQQLGTSPKQYLLARRMQLAHRELRRAEPNATTVTEVAACYGFWHFGRFASAYKSLFGELPLVTLGHAPV
jgi:AraC-like DNA-binding protein